MSNMPGERTEKSKYAGKAFLTYEEAMDYLGVRRSTLYNYLLTLNIETRKFKMDRKRYIAMRDVERIEQMKEQPWLTEEKQSSEESSDKAA